MTAEEIEIEIEEISRLTRLAKSLVAPVSRTADFETRIQLYKDINVTDADIEQFMVEAGNGNAFAESMLYVFALARLSKSDNPLDRWTFSLLKEQKRKGARGRRPSPQSWNSFVSYLVARVHERWPDLQLTKRPKRKTKVSVCWIVSEGLSRGGHPLAEGRIAEIFKEQQK